MSAADQVRARGDGIGDAIRRRQLGPTLVPEGAGRTGPEITQPFTGIARIALFELVVGAVSIEIGLGNEVRQDMAGHRLDLRLGIAAVDAGGFERFDIGKGVDRRHL